MENERPPRLPGMKYEYSELAFNTTNLNRIKLNRLDVHRNSAGRIVEKARKYMNPPLTHKIAPVRSRLSMRGKLEKKDWTLFISLSISTV